MSIMKHIVPKIMILLSFYGSLSLKAHNEYWHQRVSLFEMLPIESSDIIFLGNSITDGGEFAELFENPNVKNRGINSDTLDGVMERLRQITAGKPKKIFLLIGINDISHGVKPDEMIEKYKEIIDYISSNSPETELFVQSVLPINNSFKRYKNLVCKENDINKTNSLLKELTADTNVTYIDLWSVFSDGNGNLDSSFTNDGLHLNGQGYVKWADTIKTLVNDN